MITNINSSNVNSYRYSYRLTQISSPPLARPVQTALFVLRRAAYSVKNECIFMKYYMYDTNV